MILISCSLIIYIISNLHYRSRTPLLEVGITQCQETGCWSPSVENLGSPNLKKNMKLASYQSRGRRPRVGDMIVLNDLAFFKHYCATIKRHISMQSTHETIRISHVVPIRRIRFYSNTNQSRYSCEIVAVIRPYNDRCKNLQNRLFLSG